MKLYISKNKFELIRYLRDPLLRNSLFIMLSSISSAGLGFIFWIIAAKFYSPIDVGIGTSLISSMGLLILLSRFGIDFSIVRFFPIGDKSRIFSTSAIITTFFAFLFGVIYIAGIDVFSPELNLLHLPLNSILFLIFLVGNSMAVLTGSSFVAIRKAGYQFIQSIIVGSRILFLIPFIALGSIGVFGSVGISFILASLISFYLLLRCGIRLNLIIDKKFVNDAFHFSIGNYLVVFFMTAPNMIIPIITLNMLGAEKAAYYYIAYAIASVLFMIPNAISMSLFVEGSHGKELKKIVIKSIFLVFLILIPAVVIIYLFGGWILGLVGANYTIEGFELLKLMSLASLFVGISNVYSSIKRIQNHIKELTLISSIIFILHIGLSYCLINLYGVIGTGYAWILSYFISALIVCAIVWKEKWI